MSGKDLAVEILRQLGGNKFLAMTGAKNLGYSDDSLSFKLPRAKNTIQYVKITLNAMDLYDVVFINGRKNVIKIVSEFKNIYCEDLKSLVERETGLYLSL